MRNFVFGVLVACASGSGTFAQTVAIPQFEAVSVKPCRATSMPAAPAEGGGRKGRGNVSRAASPERLFLGCLPVRVMLVQALGAYRMGKFDGDWNPGDGDLEIEGGPDWFRSDHYTVEAVAGRALGHDLMYGPMLRAVLEDRFHLKTHRETRDVPMFAMTVAKGGLKLARPGDRSCTEPDAGGPQRDGRNFLPLNCSKLQAAQEGGCTLPDASGRPVNIDEKPPCGVLRALTGKTREIADILGASMKQIAGQAAYGSGRPVIDRTGITERFDFHLEFAPKDAPVSDDPDGLPTIFDALAQFGLKLEPTRGPRNFLVIDSIERPSEN